MKLVGELENGKILVEATRSELDRIGEAAPKSEVPNGKNCPICNKLHNSWQGGISIVDITAACRRNKAPAVTIEVCVTCCEKYHMNEVARAR